MAETATTTTTTTTTTERNTLRDALSHALATLSALSAHQAAVAGRPPILGWERVFESGLSSSSSSFSSSSSSSTPTPPGDAPGIKGVRVLRDALRREEEWADRRSNAQHSTSSNAPYLLSVSSVVLSTALTHPPVFEIGASFPLPRPSSTSSYSAAKAKAEQHGGGDAHGRAMTRGKEKRAKVDVVADGGRRWVRVNTIKPSSLLAEFREAEAYLCESDDSDSDSDSSAALSTPAASSSSRASCSKERPPLDMNDTAAIDARVVAKCSLIKLARQLVAAAAHHRRQKDAGVTRNGARHAEGDLRKYGGTSSRASLGVDIVIRLTRLVEPPDEDKGGRTDQEDSFNRRLRLILAQMRALGVTVECAADDSIPSLPPPPPTRPLRPTRHALNLDLSTLVAFVSDISHVPLSTVSRRFDAGRTAAKGGARKETGLESLFLLRAPKRVVEATQTRREEANIPGGNGDIDDNDNDNDEEEEGEGDGDREGQENGSSSDSESASALASSASGSAGGARGLRQPDSHRCALAGQLTREINAPFLIDVVNGILRLRPAAPTPSSSSSPTSVTSKGVGDSMPVYRLVTTEQARDKCLHIVELVGGPSELVRARALFGLEPVEKFWTRSRYARPAFDDVSAPVAGGVPGGAGNPATVLADHERVRQAFEAWLPIDVLPSPELVVAQPAPNAPTPSPHVISSPSASHSFGPPPPRSIYDSTADAGLTPSFTAFSRSLEPILVDLLAAKTSTAHRSATSPPTQSRSSPRAATNQTIERDVSLRSQEASQDRASRQDASLASDTVQAAVAENADHVSEKNPRAHLGEQRARSSAPLPKQTSHTLRSILLGLRIGCTTLSTNAGSVRGAAREVWKGQGGKALLAGGNARRSFPSAKEDGAEDAALWITFPRSLAERMWAPEPGYPSSSLAAPPS